MKYPNIIPLLEKELDERQRSLEKSYSSHAVGDIDDSIHAKYVYNLTILIEECESAIAELKGEKSSQNLMNSIAEWSDKQFGKGRNPTSILYHLKKEVPELIEELEKYQSMGLKDGSKRAKAMVKSFFEFADCFILILDAARSFGINMSILKEYSRMKLNINKKRKWGKADENGVVEHIRK